MTENESLELIRLLGLFVEDCGLDAIDACNKAQELLDIINDNN